VTELSLHQERVKSLTAAIAATTSTKLKAAWTTDLTATKARIAELQASPTEPAPSPGGYRERIAVCTHLGYTGTPCVQSPTMRLRLAELGVRYMRDGWGIGYPPSPDPCDTFLLELYRSFGIRCIFVCDPAKGSDLAARVAHMKKLALLGLIVAIEGPNEPGGRAPSATQLAAARDWTLRLIAAVRADPAFDGIPVLAPSLADTLDTADYNLLGPIAGLDAGNVHPYPGKDIYVGPSSTPKSPEEIEAAIHAIGVKALANARIVAGAGKPVYATETNFNSGSGGSYPSLSAADHARLMPAFVKAHAEIYEKTAIYNIAPKLAGSFEDGFALLNADLTPKPAFNALKTLLHAG
jgi:hypothetical protein